MSVDKPRFDPKKKKFSGKKFDSKRSSDRRSPENRTFRPRPDTSTPSAGSGTAAIRERAERVERNDRPERADRPERGERRTAPREDRRPASRGRGRETGRDDRPKRDFPKSDKPFRERSGDDRPKRDFPKRDFPKSDKPFRERSGDDRPKRDFPKSDKPFRERSGDDRPKRDFPKSDKPFRERSGEDRPKRDFPKSDKPFRERSGDDRPKRDFPKRDFHKSDKPFRERSNEDLPKRDFPKRDFQKSDKPFRERSSDDRPKRDFPQRDFHKKPFDKTERPARPWRDRPARPAPVDGVRAPRPSLKDSTHSRDGLNNQTRLNKYIANTGLCSRREADDLITAGTISVNGNIITTLGFKVSAGDEVRHNNAPLRTEKLVYYILNKPKDFITTSDDPFHRKTVMGLMEEAGKERIYPVGRLDRATTGVLMLTNDGDLTKKLTHPAYEIQKLYHVSIEPGLKPTDMETILEGVDYGEGKIKVDGITFIEGGSNRKEIGIEIHSGQNRVVRNIFEHLGYEIQKLDRVGFAGLTKKNLKRGAWRPLTELELASLRMMTGSKKMFRVKKEI